MVRRPKCTEMNSVFLKFFPGHNLMLYIQRYDQLCITTITTTCGSPIWPPEGVLHHLKVARPPLMSPAFIRWLALFFLVHGWNSLIILLVIVQYNHRRTVMCLQGCDLVGYLCTSQWLLYHVLRILGFKTTVWFCAFATTPSFLFPNSWH